MEQLDREQRQRRFIGEDHFAERVLGALVRLRKTPPFGEPATLQDVTMEWIGLSSRGSQTLAILRRMEREGLAYQCSDSRWEPTLGGLRAALWLGIEEPV